MELSEGDRRCKQGRVDLRHIFGGRISLIGGWLEMSLRQQWRENQASTGAAAWESGSLEEQIGVERRQVLASPSLSLSPSPYCNSVQYCDDTATKKSI